MPPAALRQRRLLYGRKRGPRLRPGRARLLEELLPKVEIRLPESGRIDPTGLFPDARPLWLEIGFGGGEHLAELARRHPERGFIGCEPFVNGLARMLAVIEAEGLANVRLVADDARILLAALPDSCLDGVVLLFPDPWPKARHHKRRIVNQATAEEIARVLRLGGELRLATDHPGYAAAMLEVLLARRELAWTARRPADWRVRPAHWPPTRYEAKAQSAGARPVYFRFVRRTSPSAADCAG